MSFVGDAFVDFDAFASDARDATVVVSDERTAAQDESIAGGIDDEDFWVGGASDDADDLVIARGVDLLGQQDVGFALLFHGAEAAQVFGHDGVGVAAERVAR